MSLFFTPAQPQQNHHWLYQRMSRSHSSLLSCQQFHVSMRLAGSTGRIKIINIWSFWCCVTFRVLFSIHGTLLSNFLHAEDLTHKETQWISCQICSQWNARPESTCFGPGDCTHIFLPWWSKILVWLLLPTCLGAAKSKSRKESSLPGTSASCPFLKGLSTL